jgi:signal transduction histidine kinase
MRRPLVSGGAAAAYLALLVAGAVAGLAPLSDDLAYSYVVSVVAAVSLGYGVALSRARASLAEQQTVELAREQEVRTRTAVEQEQARIAREMHDIVAHDVSVIVAQAAATRRVLSQEPEEAARSLSSIEAVGRDALDGLRRLVSPLRTESAATDRSPQPDLDRLPWLLAQVRRAGLPVDLVIHGRPSPLSAAVELNAYRIVQEALTNSLKHAAGGARATVTLEYADDALSVEVHDETVDDALAAVPAQRVRWKPTAAQERDHGRSSTETSAIGFGMISMRQRATMLGGDFSAGPDNGGGFRVAARLPVDGVTR